VIREQLTNTPASARDPGRHRRGALAHGLSRHLTKTGVGRTKVVDRTDQPHAGLQSPCRAAQSPRVTCQARQALAKRPVEPLDVGCVDDTLTRRGGAGLLDLVGSPVYNTALDLDNAASVVAFDHLGDQQSSPDPQRLATASTRRDLVAERFAGGTHVRTQAIGTDEQTPSPRTAAHALHQASDQEQIAAVAHLAAEPQPCGHLDRHGHPDDGALELDPQFIGLHLPESPRRLDQVLVHSVAVPAGPIEPVGDRAFVEAEGGDDGLDGAAVGEQRDDKRDSLSRGAQAVKGRTAALGEGLATLPAEETTLFLGMHADVAFTRLPSGRTVHIRTECLCGVHDGSPLDRIACSVIEDALWTHSFLLFNPHHG